MLDFVDEAFHEMTFSIQSIIVFTHLLGSWMGWNNRLCALFNHKINTALGSITTIRDGVLKVVSFNQVLSLCDVMALSATEPKTQGTAQLAGVNARAKRQMIQPIKADIWYDRNA